MMKDNEGQSQNDLLYQLLSDFDPHRTDEIMMVVYGGDHLGLARVAARIYDIKKKYKVEIKSRKDENNPALTWYQMIRPDQMSAPDPELMRRYPILFETKLTPAHEMSKQTSLL